MIRFTRLRFSPVQAGLLLLMALAFGCAKQPTQPVFDSADTAWQIFRQQYCEPVAQPGMKLKTSLTYSREHPERQSSRTIVSIWGDFDGPVRLNVATPIGKIVAMIRENEKGLLVYYPTEDKAYGHTNSVLGATRLGMPFPFSLTELAKVSMGDFSGLVPNHYTAAEQAGDHYVFTLQGAQATSVTVDREGRPIIIEGNTAKAYSSSRAWRLEMEKYGKDGSPLPAKLTLTMNNGEKGILRIKTRELRVERWATRSTRLTLPDDTLYYRLEGHDSPPVLTDIPTENKDL